MASILIRGGRLVLQYSSDEAKHQPNIYLEALP